ncbi:MAG TPA: phosphohydrolase, partial [Sphingomonadaceae bacterium]|nr:phosphohydrolase [Sphingomonadaceae bacterium]
LGMDRELRERFRGHEHFSACAEFCEKYDQSAFDPDYDSAPLEFFEPMVRRVMARPKHTIYEGLAED